MMNARENYLAYLNHEPVDWVPCVGVDMYMLGGQREEWENGPLGQIGFDGFGNNWIPTDGANGQPALDPTILPITDVTEWESQLKLPNLDAIDWKAYAEEQLAGVDRSAKVLEYHTWNSIYLRLGHLLGFEEALCSFYEEPEATLALCDRLADYKIALLERVHEYIKPDTFVHYDDVTTSLSLFMSPSIYCEFIKPAHKRINDAAIAMGMIPQIHVCGKCEDIVEDIIEEGSQAWQSAQPMNDLAGIIQRYGDRLSVTGGYDTQGAPGQADASEEITAAEVLRCMDEYGRFGKSYCFMGFKLGFRDPFLIQEAMREGRACIEKLRNS